MAATLQQERVAHRVAEREEELAALAAALLRFDTTAGPPEGPAREEADLQDFLAARLRRAGAEVRVWEPDPATLAPWREQVGDGIDFSGRPQLVARWPGAGAGRSLILNGHVDAVSAEPRDAWTVGPFEGVVEDGYVVGRGACDMKGGIAAMVVAAETVLEETGGLAGDLVVNTVTDEESSGAGALACIAAGLVADAAIVPEPTGFDVWVACRGSVTPTVRVLGRPGHAELPQPHWREGGAVNAIEKLALLLEAVRELREHWASDPRQRHPHLAPGTVVPVLLSGGEWFVTYPAAAEVTCELMHLPGVDGAQAQAEFQAWIDRAAEADDWLSEHPPAVSWGPKIPPAEIPADHPLAQAMLESARSLGIPSEIAGFNSWYDGASFVLSASTPAVAFGPPETSLAHAVDERVATSDLVRCAQALASAVVEWCRVV